MSDQNLQMNHTYYIRQGDAVSAVRLPDGLLLDAIPPAVYTVSFSSMEGFYLTEVKQRFELPTPVFGRANDRKQKVLNTYHGRNESMGVLMTGNKGSGKTLLIEMIANEFLDSGKPVIMVNQPYAGDTFMNFVDMLGEACFIFDEFAKVYSSKHTMGRGRAEEVSVEDDNSVQKRGSQENLLSLMDGTLSRKRLILLSENSKYSISTYLLNRPGRIHYHFEYKKVEEDVIQDMCAHNDVSQVAEEIIDTSRKVREFNVDMVKAIINEYRMYQQPIKDLVEDLNISFQEAMYDYVFEKGVLPDGTECKTLSKARQFSFTDLDHNTHFFVMDPNFVPEVHMPDGEDGELYRNRAPQLTDMSDDEAEICAHIVVDKNMLYEDANQIIFTTQNNTFEKVYFKKVYKSNTFWNAI